MFDNRDRVVPALFALLLVTSLAAPALAGLASAQGSTYTKTLDTEDARYVAFDTEGWDAGEVEVEVTANDGPGGDPVVLYRETHTTAELQNHNTVEFFENAGAYHNMTVTIDGAPEEPGIAPGSKFSATKGWRHHDMLASTGGDRDLMCDLSERLAQAANPAIDIVDCMALPDTRSFNQSSVDADQAELEIYKSAAAQKDASESIHTMLKNRLQDTETVALTKAKNGYIRSLNEGGSQTAAEAAAVDNVTDFYSVMEYNLVQRWNAQVANTQYLLNAMDNESAISDSYINASKEDFYDGKTSDIGSIKIEGTSTRTVTLQNGTNVEAKTLLLNVTGYNSYNVNEIGPMDDKRIAASEGYIDGQDSGYTYASRNATASNLWVQPPESNYGAENFFTMEKFYYRFNEIDTQTQAATNQAETLVTQTYDEYQQGEINNSDLIDPYVLQNEFSPGDGFEAWTASTLALLGTNQPTNLSSTGYMNVTLEDGTQLRGVIQSAENPASGQFEVNTTYNPDNIGGTQWITTEDSVRELQQNFTISNISTNDGERRQNFTIVKKTYATESSDDLSKLYNELSLLREQLEVREDWLRGASAGGAILDGMSNTELGIVVTIIIGIGGLAMRGNNGGGGSGRY
jgi:hypothetical protein